MTSTGFASPEWLDQGSLFLEEDGVRVPLYTSRLRGLIPLLCTPPWALHVDWRGEPATQDKLKRALTRAHSTVSVIDLGPETSSSLTAPEGWQEVRRHTRQLPLDDTFEATVPKTRVKQARRFERESGTLEVHEGPAGWDEVLNLHRASRDRKGLQAQPEKLEALLARIAPTDWSFAVLARDVHGACIASGGFVILPDQTCVYAFGGQARSQASGRASVAMLLEAMRHAHQRGCERFDFGGSQDSGVDQFYAEFGSEVVFMRRWVRAPRWFQWLFPCTWQSWTRPSAHK